LDIVLANSVVLASIYSCINTISNHYGKIARQIEQVLLGKTIKQRPPAHRLSHAMTIAKHG